MKYTLRMKYFAIIHLTGLFLTGVTSTDQLYSIYKDVKPNKYINYIYEFQRDILFQYYYRYTGTETGFGFFAPNVKGNCFLLPEFCNKSKGFSMLTNEGNSRLSTMVSNSTDYITNKKNKNENETINKYNELVIKNIALSSRLRTNVDCEKVDISLYVIDFPSLYKLKTNSKTEPDLINIQTWTYEINK